MPDEVHLMTLKLEFPEGISPGDGRSGNRQILAVDGLGHPVLRGTALAGALRHAWARLRRMPPRSDEVNAWFGMALQGTGNGFASPLRVPDARIQAGESPAPAVERTHIAIDRNTGAVRSSALSSMESLPPGCAAHLALWLHAATPVPGAQAILAPKQFLAEIAALLNGGITLGRGYARGLGRVTYSTPPRIKSYNMAKPSDLADYLNDHRDIRGGQLPSNPGAKLSLPNAGAPIRGFPEPLATALSLHLTLGIAPGQDLLLGDGEGLDFVAEPQCVKDAEGRTRWRLPGSSLRGVFRHWFTRLARRAGEKVALEVCVDDSPVEQDRIERELLRQEDTLARSPEGMSGLIGCPIRHLFGSVHNRGRIHVSDGLSTEEAKESHKQIRSHVAIDRISGGANDGFLFSNTVLTPGPAFPVTIRVDNPSETEANRLLATLRALQAGVLRLGSGKSSGWLNIMSIKAEGPFKDKFTQSQILENTHV